MAYLDDFEDIQNVLSFNVDANRKPEFEPQAVKMALWAKTQKLPNDKLQSIQQVYIETGFPIEVRHCLATWIENQPWDNIDEENSENGGAALEYINELIQQLKARAMDYSDEYFTLRLQLENAAKIFIKDYMNNPLALVKAIKQCLAMEKKYVQEITEEEMDIGTIDLPGNQEISKELLLSKQWLQETENSLKILQQHQEALIIKLQENSRFKAHMLQLQQDPKADMKALQKEREEQDSVTLEKTKELIAKRMEVTRKFQAIIEHLNTLQVRILDEELINWRRKQQLAGTGLLFDENLTTLQQWCDELAMLLWHNRQEIKKHELLRNQLPVQLPSNIVDVPPELNTQITALLSKVVTSSFVVEHQPPQILKKDSRFTATVRLLVGGKLNVHMNPPKVKAVIINEQQANMLLTNASSLQSRNDSCGDLLNNMSTMEYHENKGHLNVLSVIFRNMQLKKIKRADRKGCEAVTEEKFCILFQTNFRVGGDELDFHVWTLSLPVVVTVHGNQECNALATILWDNTFAEPGRTLFHVPEVVLWLSVADMLSCKFQSVTGKALKDEDKNYLATKIFGGSVTDDFSQEQISRAQIFKENLKDRSFTFWEWFFGILKLSKEHLSEQMSTIIGFISRMQAQDWLLAKPNGTFLLRFSDSAVGGISIAWVNSANNSNEKVVWNLAPYHARMLQMRSLPNRIRDLSDLQFLYPDIPKDTAFEKYYDADAEQQQSTMKSGYVVSELKECITNIDIKTSAVSPTSTYDSCPLPKYELDSSLDGIENLDTFDDFITDYGADDIMLNDLLECKSA